MASPDRKPRNQPKHPPPEAIVAADIDDRSWQLPPPSTRGKKQPFWVDLRFNLFRVKDVNTVASTAFVNFGIVCYWTDPRLAGWPADGALPPLLWGPHLMLKNAMGDLQEVESSFDLADAATGRLKRGREFRGTIDNPMDLRAFPFDMDRIELLFYTSAHWLTRNGENSGSATKGKTYRVRHIREPGEGKWLNLLWDGGIEEWNLHGVSTRILEKPPNPQGQEHTDVPLSFHVTRKSGYYFWKALLPLYLLTALSMSTFHFEVDNLPDRTATVATYFLAGFAMLYVVGASLPKTDFLTKIDRIIVITTVLISLVGLSSLCLATAFKRHGKEVAERWNLATELALIVGYCLANLLVFVPTALHQQWAVAKLAGYSAKSKVGAVGSGVAKGTLPTVAGGCDYATLKDLAKK
mmetsp:Transcript_74685/g.211004  ORF Transcript_74685/g.211004 Transcript_74685/m.211004 type:complete len:409 (+) Transcript_74685:64-1290(+)